MQVKIIIGEAKKMQPSEPTETYTWAQKLRFFVLGASWAVLLTMGPVGITLWDAVQHYNDPVDWPQIEKLAAASAVPALIAYWRKHKALLEIPPGLVVPDEFKPNRDSGM